MRRGFGPLANTQIPRLRVIQFILQVLDISRPCEYDLAMRPDSTAELVSYDAMKNVI